MNPILVMAANRYQFDCYFEARKQLNKLDECNRMHFLSSRHMCVGYSDAFLICMDGAQLNIDYDKRFFESLYPRLNKTSKKMLLEVIAPEILSVHH